MLETRIRKVQYTLSLRNYGYASELFVPEYEETRRKRETAKERK